jgi:hypothetical protein
MKPGSESAVNRKDPRETATTAAVRRACHSGMRGATRAKKRAEGAAMRRRLPRALFQSGPVGEGERERDKERG